MRRDERLSCIDVLLSAGSAKQEKGGGIHGKVGNQINRKTG